MIPGASKTYLVETLNHFNVNRVEYYSLYDFDQRKFPPSKLFGLRCLASQSAKFYYRINFGDIVKLLQSMDVSPRDYIACDSLQVEDSECLIMNGEGSVTDSGIKNGIEKGDSDLKLYNYHGVINRTSGISCREAALNTDLDTRTQKKTTQIINRWRDMPASLIDLIWQKNLVGYVIEFSIYNKPIGIKNEQLLIWEIRKY